MAGLHTWVPAAAVGRFQIHHVGKLHLIGPLGSRDKIGFWQGAKVGEHRADIALVSVNLCLADRAVAAAFNQHGGNAKDIPAVMSTVFPGFDPCMRVAGISTSVQHRLVRNFWFGVILP